MKTPQIPEAPRSIQKGTPLKHLLGPAAVECLAQNICLVYPAFDSASFCQAALDQLEPLPLMARSQHIASALHQTLPKPYKAAVRVLTDSFAPPPSEDSIGLAGFFYLPHSSFIATYGCDPSYNNGADPFEASLQAQYALTTRFTAEFCIRPFLIQQLDRTLAVLNSWAADPDPRVRRLCSEGTRPRLPWGLRIPSLIANPQPVLPLLERLKDDPSLYVRRSVANHLGDIAKDHPEWVFQLCDRWLSGASNDRKWLIRHALRYPAKQGNAAALAIRASAK